MDEGCLHAARTSGAKISQDRAGIAMKFGLFLLGERPPGVSDSEVYSNAIEQARVADELGYDEVWLAEHHFAPYGTIADPLVLAAAIATVTSRIRIGTAVVIPSFHAPIQLAERIAMVDVLSGGRLDLGIGRGYQKREFEKFGIPMDESRARMEEGVAILEGLLSNESFSMHGNFWDIEDVAIYPRPVQKKVPIFIAALRTIETIRWIIHRGYDALVGNPYLVDPQLGESLKLFGRARAEAGATTHATEVWALINGFVHEDEEFARNYPRRSTELGWKYVQQYGDPFTRGSAPSREYQAYADWFDSHDTVSYERMLSMESTLIGNPDTVISRMSVMHQRDGWENFMLCLNRGGALERTEVIKALELMATAVIPEVRKIATRPM